MYLIESNTLGTKRHISKLCTGWLAELSFTELF